MNEEYYLMWLTKIEGIGLKRIDMLLNSFSSAREIWDATEKLLRALPYLTPRNIDSIISSKDEKHLYLQIRKMEFEGIRFISKYNDQYPVLLKEIHDPPLGIYALGKLPQKENVLVSIIGSRRCTGYGRTAAYNISKGLAEKGVVIVSGMAKGIDGVAHEGAVDADGYTVAVLGCGVDICYPAENRALREGILKKGCLISEFPPGTEPLPSHFPLRNRIISGMSKVLIVVEAAQKSGTLITVNQALEQGRDVMAIPGPISSKLSQGTNELIRDGAGIVTSHSDVLDALGLHIEDNSQKKLAELTSELTADEKKVYSFVRTEAVTAIQVSQGVNMDIGSITYILVLLEIKGLIKKLQGNRFVRC